MHFSQLQGKMLKSFKDKVVEIMLLTLERSQDPYAVLPGKPSEAGGAAGALQCQTGRCRLSLLLFPEKEHSENRAKFRGILVESEDQSEIGNGVFRHDGLECTVAGGEYQSLSQSELLKRLAVCQVTLCQCVPSTVMLFSLKCDAPLPAFLTIPPATAPQAEIWGIFSGRVPLALDLDETVLHCRPSPSETNCRARAKPFVMLV